MENHHVYIVHKINADKSKTFEGVFTKMGLAQEHVMTNGAVFVANISITAFGRTTRYGGHTSFEIIETKPQDK